jgi:hypothetical protein
MPQSPLQRIVVLLAALAVSAAQAHADPAVTAVQYQRRQIYHSPQTPGYTCWLGAWVMSDDSIMISFTQATGPIPGRPKAPENIREKLSWPPAGHEAYDMTGLELRNVHLRSSDGGATWQHVSADPFRSCMNGVTGECETALQDGTILRGVWGHYLPLDADVPKTGYLQRSIDGSKTWSGPEVLLDPSKFTAWPKRLRLLRDSRLILLGGLAKAPADSLTRAEYSKRLQPLLMVSQDQGKTWSAPISVVPQEQQNGWGGEEFDAAELPNGDLLCVFRRLNTDGPGEVRWQNVLNKDGATWAPQPARPAPFPHSGHPELLATREGPILHVATSGIHWTADAGRTWHPLNVPGTLYYPRSVQTRAGRIYFFAHHGSDDAYGAVDQYVAMDSFRLQQTP